MEIDVEAVRKLIREQLEPELERRCREMSTSIAADLERRHLAFQLSIRKEVRHDHAENRIRFQQIHDTTTTAVAEGKAISNTTSRIEARVDGVFEALAEIREMVGRRDGERTAEERHSHAEAEERERQQKRNAERWKLVQWIVGISASLGAAGKWISTHWEHWTK